MQNETDYLTKIKEGYPRSHLIDIQLVIQYAYRAVLDLTSGKGANPIFDTPQKEWFSGLLRYIAVDSFLERACGEMKLLKGISPVWSPLTDSESGVLGSAARERMIAAPAGWLEIGFEVFLSVEVWILKFLLAGSLSKSLNSAHALLCFAHRVCASGFVRPI